MKDFAPSTLWTIAEELIGTIPLYVAVVFALFFAMLFIVALLRRHGFKGSAARTGLITGVVVGVGTILIAPLMTQAAFTNLHGVLDWAALIVVGLLAFAGTVVAVYGLLGFGRRA